VRLEADRLQSDEAGSRGCLSLLSFTSLSLCLFPAPFSFLIFLYLNANICGISKAQCQLANQRKTVGSGSFWPSAKASEKLSKSNNAGSGGAINGYQWRKRGVAWRLAKVAWRSGGGAAVPAAYRRRVGASSRANSYHKISVCICSYGIYNILLIAISCSLLLAAAWWPWWLFVAGGWLWWLDLHRIYLWRLIHYKCVLFVSCGGVEKSAVRRELPCIRSKLVA